MSGDGVQRVCPECAELNLPDAIVCRECGTALVEPDEARRLLGFDTGPSVFDDPGWRRRETERSDTHPWRAKEETK